ncbi:MAG: FtsX-like permease family protein [Oscillospiraceae bacterium]|nr:FtsX-like permease family protein [Oscillospiraceae bacterium]
MQLIENIRLAFTSLFANKMRALLTMLGIIIGISAVIMITTIGTTIQKTLSNTFNSFGSYNIFDVILDWEDSVSEDDLISREMLDELVAEYPDYFAIELTTDCGQATTRNSKGDTITMSVSGVLDVKPMLDHLRGRTIQYKDNINKKNALYVSDLFISQYFEPGVDPIGQEINLTFENGLSGDFVIVGYDKLPQLYEKMYTPGMKKMEKVSPVSIPCDTYNEMVHQESEPSYYAQIRYNTDYDVTMQQDALQGFFEEKYKEKPGITFRIINEQQYLGMIDTIINVVTIAISVIAAISLIVGGVGVMNIMLVSITERTKEIGIRKALGAQNSAIRMQFVIEAIMICLIGGIIGIVLGILGGLAIGWIAKTLVTEFYSEYAELISITIQPSIPAIIISVFFSILTGVFFGYYPANKAAKMNPIDALRYD